MERGRVLLLERGRVLLLERGRVLLLGERESSSFGREMRVLLLVRERLRVLLLERVRESSSFERGEREREFFCLERERVLLLERERERDRERWCSRCSDDWKERQFKFELITFGAGTDRGHDDRDCKFRVPEMSEVCKTAHLVERARSKSFIVGGNPRTRVVVFPIPRVGLLVERSAVSGLAIRRLRLTPAPVSFHIPRGTHTLGCLRRDKGKRIVTHVAL